MQWRIYWQASSQACLAVWHKQLAAAACRGDEEADENSKLAAEMTANHFLACLPACARLEVRCAAEPPLVCR